MGGVRREKEGGVEPTEQLIGRGCGEQSSKGETRWGRRERLGAGLPWGVGLRGEVLRAGGGQVLWRCQMRRKKRAPRGFKGILWRAGVGRRGGSSPQQWVADR